MIRVQGNCPMGCGHTLFVGNGGHITCSLGGCPDPCAADRLLTVDAAEHDHIVTLTETGYTISHPLRERVTGGLEACQLHALLADTARNHPSALPAEGRYRSYQAGPRDSWIDTGGSFTLYDDEVAWRFLPVEWGVPAPDDCNTPEHVGADYTGRPCCMRGTVGCTRHPAASDLLAPNAPRA